ncbi:hypothetical protein GK047_23500 [Paenibacillus sp. SYP-B3998]|uniref:Uncharacterized protein n=2 Tax=Paenibacillus sp. SYP-B3998 TaxID=2678564 RepID=A0A6G4A4U5_9BACL|nr:hypothetical protein [Paenibacillus sp. SYP-B3998]
MIRKLDRTGIDIHEVKTFFGIVSGIRTFTPPTVEFMSVLKTYRTALFSEYKRSLIPSTSMWFISNVTMDVGDALVSLGIRDVEHLEQCIKG